MDIIAPALTNLVYDMGIKGPHGELLTEEEIRREIDAMFPSPSAFVFHLSLHQAYLKCRDPAVIRALFPGGYDIVDESKFGDVIEYLNQCYAILA